MCTNPDDLDELIRIAQSGNIVEEKKAPSILDDFILLFELEKSDSQITPVWALYRAYRITANKPLSKNKFKQELSKHFKRAVRYFFVVGKIDVSEEAWWAERRFEADQRAQKEREKKERLKDKPYIKYRASKDWAAYKERKKKGEC